MESKLTLIDLAQGLAARKGMSKKEAESFVRNVFGIIEQALADGELVKVKGLGTFKLVVVESRESINVNTGERFTIDSHPKVAFTPDPVLRDQINKPFADFDTILLNDSTSTEEMEFVEEHVEETSLATGADESVSWEEEVASPPAPAVESSLVENQSEAATGESLSASGMTDMKPEEVSCGINTLEQEPATQRTEDMTHIETQVVEELNIGSQHVEHQTIQQVISSALEHELAKRHGVHLSWGGVAAFALLGVLLMIGSCYFGFRMGLKEAIQPRILVSAAHTAPARGEKLKSKQRPLVEVARKVPVCSETKQTSTVVVKEVAKPQPSAAELAKQFSQLEQGEYWIVGTKAEHMIVVGDNLYKLARKTYGDKELAAYIIHYNRISNPDNIHLGAKLKLPELVKK